jgi:S1-C subfamily serine protease
MTGNVKKTIAILIGTLLMVISIQALALEGLPAIIATMKPSVVGVGTTSKNSIVDKRFLGTGFIVGDGTYVVTANHVAQVDLNIENMETLSVLSSAGGQKILIRPARKVFSDREHDLALLKVDGPALPAVAFGDSDTMAEGTDLAFTGFPIGAVLGFHPVTHRAMLSAITPVVSPVDSSSQLSTRAIKQMMSPFMVFQLDATAYPGNSGSPLYEAASGRVIGLLNMVFVKDTKEHVLSEPSGIAYAIPGKFITQMLKDAGVSY